MNFAAVRKLPVVYFCTNNQYAYSTPVRYQMAITDVVERAKAYGMPGKLWMATTSPLSTLPAVAPSLRPGPARARRFSSLRRCACTGIPNMMRRSMSRENYWRNGKPKILFSGQNGLLMTLGYADESYFRDVGERAKKEVDAGAEFAEQSPLPEGRETLVGVFASLDEVSA